MQSKSDVNIKKQQKLISEIEQYNEQKYKLQQQLQTLELVSSNAIKQLGRISPNSQDANTTLPFLKPPFLVQLAEPAIETKQSFHRTYKRRLEGLTPGSYHSNAKSDFSFNSGSNITSS